MTLRDTWFVIGLALASFAGAPRQVQPFNDGWTFVGPSVDGRRVERPVTLPHTWNADDASLGLDYSRGTGTYTRLFTPPPEWRGRRLFLRFEGANTVADVMVNDRAVGQHRGGYSAFAFEITPLVEFGRENRIAVRVDNAPHDDVIPLSGDFNIYGGLHRPAQLIVTGPLCIDPLDHASPGVYLRQKNVAADRAAIDVTTLVSNLAAPSDVSVEVVVRDAGGNPVAEARTPARAATGRTAVATPIEIASPHLWNGRADPYLYRVQVRLLAGRDVVDEVEQPLGLRTFRVDAGQGLFLNGTRLKVHGVSRHQDWSGKGSALSTADHDRDLALILEIGANAVRLSHYQHADYFHDLCDRSGLIVWAEIPFVGSLGPGFSNSPALKANIRDQLLDLIRQNYNHPSIFFWGISNELSAGKGDQRPDGILGELNDLAHAEDPTRLTTQASIAFNGVADSLNLITDVIAFNEYFGWYFGQATALGPWADEQHRLRPSRAIAVSEYGAGGSPFQHEASPKRPFPMFHAWHPEEYQAIVHEQNWRAIADRPFVWGSFVWNMFDFGSTFRREGPIDAINDKGLVTYDRTVRKDAFFFYKANWSADPVLHLASKRYVVRREASTPIKVYSNLPSVTVTLNGVSLGSRAPDAIRVAEWPGARLAKGNNVVAVTGRDAAGRTYEDGAVWVYDGMPWMWALTALFRWLIKPLYVLSVIKLIVLYVLSFRVALSRGWRRFWRVCFVLCVIWCVALAALYVVGLHYGMGVFDYSQI